MEGGGREEEDQEGFLTSSPCKRFENEVRLYGGEMQMKEFAVRMQ